jgi:hypothetical protein
MTKGLRRHTPALRDPSHRSGCPRWNMPTARASETPNEQLMKTGLGGYLPRDCFIATNARSPANAPERTPMLGPCAGDMCRKRGLVIWAHELCSGPHAALMAATSKCLARTNKTRTAVRATKATGGAIAQSLAPRLDPLRVSAAGPSPPLAARVERSLNMSWHHPDLYFFLCLAGSLTVFLVPSIIDDELLARRRKPPVAEPRRSTVNEKAADPPSPPQYVDPPSPPKYLKNVRPLEGLQRDRPARPTGGRASERPSDFSQLCESLTPLPPQEQASRVRKHFGILGGARPAEGPGRRAKNAGH